MERKEPSFIQWPNAGDLFVKQVVQGEQTGREIYSALQGELIEFPFGKKREIGQASVYKAIQDFLGLGFIEVARRGKSEDGEVLPPWTFRLTDEGSKAAYYRGLISHEDMLRVIQTRERDPYFLNEED